MYVTAHWVQAFNKDLGTNIYAHWGDPQRNKLQTESDAKYVVNNPGPRDESLTRGEIPPRMNKILASVDIVLDEKHGNGELSSRIRSALEAHDASTDGWSEHDGVFVRFFLQPYMSARADTYNMLRAQLERWLTETFELRAAS